MANKDSLYFTFDGIDSEAFGIMQVSVSSGSTEEDFGHGRSLIETRIYGQDKSYLHGYQTEPKKIPVTFYLEDYNDQEKLNRINRWLYQSEFKPLYFSNNPHRIYYVMLIDQPTITHNSINQAVVNVTFQSNSPYAYSPVYNISKYFTNNSNGTMIEIENKGIKPVHLDMEIVKKGLGDIEVINYTNSNQFKLKTNLDGEQITIDSENKDIITSLPNTYRYKDFSGDYMKLAVGINRLKVIGDGEFYFTYYNVLP